jgi:hypothetical protein
MYSRNDYGYVQYSFPVHDSESAAATGLIPVELDFKGHCEDQDRGRKESACDKVIPPHVLSVSKRHKTGAKKF